MTTPRPSVIELVQTTGPRKRVPGDTQTYWHARIRAAGNRRVTWWSEDYPRRGGAVHAIELLPGCDQVSGGVGLARFGATILQVRTVDARLGRP